MEESQQPEVEVEKEKPEKSKVLRILTYLFVAVFLLSLGA